MEVFVVQNGSINVRDAPNGAKVGMLPQGALVVASGPLQTDAEHDWSWIPFTWGAGTAFICQGQYCKSAECYVVQNGGVNVRDAPNGQELGKLKNGTVLTALGPPQTDPEHNWSWIPFEWQGSTAFVCRGRYCAPAGHEDLQLVTNPDPQAVRRNVFADRPFEGSVTVRQDYTHSGGPCTLDVWLCLPPDQAAVREWQPHEPSDIVTDACGNNFGHWHLNVCGGSDIAIGYSCTLSLQARQWEISPVALDSLPRCSQHELYTKPTHCFDYENEPEIRDAAGQLRAASTNVVSFLASVYKLCNERLAVRGATGPQMQASYFWKEGVGRCYAHTLVFCALCRAGGVAARACAGAALTPRLFEHSWAQVFVPTTESPGGEWVDMDAQLDDDDRHGPGATWHWDYFAQRRAGTWPFFFGNYDALHKVEGGCFTSRLWFGCWECNGDYVAQDGGVNVRDGPNGRVLGKLEEGTVLTALGPLQTDPEHNSSWIPFEWQGSTTFVCRGQYCMPAPGAGAIQIRSNARQCSSDVSIAAYACQ